jgi:hypothetical protein
MAVPNVSNSNNNLIKSPRKDVTHLILLLSETRRLRTDIPTEFLSIHDLIHNARPHADLSFRSLSSAQLESLANQVEDAIKQYKREAGLSVDDIPWIGLPKTFWYWTANMWHYNKSLVIMPCAITEPKNGEEVRVAVEIAKLAGVQVRRIRRTTGGDS